MKRGIRLLIFAAALIVLAGGWLLLRSMDLNGEKKTEDTSAVLSSVSEADITKISWTYNGETLSFTRAGSAWAYDGDADFPASQTALDGMASQLKEVKASQAILISDNLADYGLAEPALLVEFQAAGNTYSYAFGNKNDVSGEYYALFNGDKTKVYALGSALPEAFKKELYDVLAFETIPDLSRAVSLTVESEGRTRSLVYVADAKDLSYSSEYKYFYYDEASCLPVSDKKFSDKVGVLSNLVLSECASYKATDEDLARYGLDRPAVRAVAEYTDSDGVSASITFSFGAYKGDSCYMRMNDSRMVYLVKASAEDELALLSYGDVRPDEVCLMDWDTVTSLDIALDGKSYSIALEKGEGGESRVFRMDGRELDAEAGQELLDAIRALKSTGEASSDLGRGEKLSITFRRNTEKFSQMTLTLSKYDSSSDLASFGGETRLLVSSSGTDGLIELIRRLTA